MSIQYATSVIVALVAWLRSWWQRRSAPSARVVAERASARAAREARIAALPRPVHVPPGDPLHVMYQVVQRRHDPVYPPLRLRMTSSVPVRGAVLTGAEVVAVFRGVTPWVS